MVDPRIFVKIVVQVEDPYGASVCVDLTYTTFTCFLVVRWTAEDEVGFKKGGDATLEIGGHLEHHQIHADRWGHGVRKQVGKIHYTDTRAWRSVAVTIRAYTERSILADQDTIGTEQLPTRRKYDFFPATGTGVPKDLRVRRCHLPRCLPLRRIRDRKNRITGAVRPHCFELMKMFFSTKEKKKRCLVLSV